MTQDAASVSAALRDAASALSSAGVESAAHDARVLMAAALTRESGVDVGPLDLVMRGGDAVPASFATMLQRRVEREPLQWILGYGTVAGIDLAVGPGVFVPRPETDLLIDWVAGEAQRRVALREDPLFARLLEPTLTIVDLCSGPGTIALGVAHELGTRGIVDAVDAVDAVGVRVIGLEITAQGVEQARDNHRTWVAEGHVDPRIAVEFHRADVATPEDVVALGLVASADIVASNPPYVPETTEVSPEVARDPHAAVFSGTDGLELMRPLAEVIDLVAAPSAGVAVEHDDSTGADVRQILAGVGVTELEQHRDFAGRDRFVTGQVHRDPGHRPTRG
ncbi:MAG: N5-glutamine methyltransferase family protein [Corynebacterium sp.]|uniref:N5-glutamine methyltransferase family protein n=1 Tax=unclassified Corynebacterium TaxID=2624378 RepID=UPI0026485E12|nr:HemK/PrmC family methyltransferase [Corynebacterium sp.]MDN5581157.1 peptide chain release factor N(5)-glutamine methyltransferase [Corynebacterium sp.]MDN5718716.1 peptide chain release factor N(5)-glutamine methyltransferase [Corynebacterium sp.]MDN6510153.1 peptide chain release factor N(5)-glutamine methyltransferase [Corynebacterium sp.]